MSDGGDFATAAVGLISQLEALLKDQQSEIDRRQLIIKELDAKIADLESLSAQVDKLRQEQRELIASNSALAAEQEQLQRKQVKLRKNNSSSSLTVSPSESSTVSGAVEGGAELRHADSSFEIRPDNNNLRNNTRLSRVIDDSARHHYSISPELEARTQEVIHKKYGGREKAERAARVIQESYRQYRLRQSFHKLRQAKRRRLTLDSLASSNAEIETALANHKKEVVLNIKEVDVASEEPISEIAPEKEEATVKEENGETEETEKEESMMKPLSELKETHRLSAISIADSQCSNQTNQRASYIESDESENEEQKKQKDDLYKNIHRNSWIQPDNGAQSENEVLRKRMYRIGLNLFNKKPEKGLAFLIKHSFVADSPTVIANFLVTRKGISRQVLGEYLGSGGEYTKKILKSLCNEIDLAEMDVDEALRKFQSTIRIQGEAQRVERLIEAFAQRFLESNPEMARQLENPDSIFILAFAIIMLNTDLHSPSMRKEKRMSEEDFIKNLSGINNGKDLDLEMLANIYNRIKKHEYKANDDHINQVLVIDQRIIGRSKPTLAMPHRRLVCYCRMYQIADLNRPQRVGVHQREVFLFNDLLLITKLSGRRRSQYLFRQSYQLLNLEVEAHNNDNYPYAIKIFESSVQQIMFSFPNKQDRQNFLQDITESIQEVKHMESLRIEDSLEEMREERKENQKSPLTATRKLSSSLHNLSITKEKELKGSESFRVSSLSPSATAIPIEKKPRSSSLHASSATLTPVDPEKSQILDRSASVVSSSGTLTTTDGGETESSSGFFGFLKSRKNSQTVNQQQIDEEQAS